MNRGLVVGLSWGWQGRRTPLEGGHPISAHPRPRHTDRDATYAALAEDVAAKAVRGRQYWIGVVGAPASGKSTTAREVARRLREERGLRAVVVPMDGYHYYRREVRLSR